MNTIKQISGIGIVAAIMASTAVSAATNDSVLARISNIDEAPVSYTLAGKNQAESDFRRGILPSALGPKPQAEEKAVSYKVRYQYPVAVIPARSEFRNKILSSAKGKATEETAQFARFHLMEK